MKEKYLLFGLLLFLACKDKEILKNNHTTSRQIVSSKNSVKDFVWKGMNMFYNWQDKVPDLADEKSKNINEYEEYLNTFEDPQKLFETLLYKSNDPNIHADRFSWYIEDYVEQEKSFQGIQTSYGFSPAVIKTKSSTGEDIQMILVARVSKNSPAAKAGLKRGDILIGANGITDWNILVSAYYADTADFLVGEKDGKTIIKTISMTKEEVSDDAIHLTKIFDIDGEKVGYFVYNGFRSSYDKALNTAFLEFKNQGITKLVLDLRYNGGGSVLSCGYLSSLIYGKGSDKDIFAITKWNSKQTDAGYELPFFNNLLEYDENQKKYVSGEPLNRVNTINKLYVLTSGSTASASEMVINGLKPYMNVVTIGTKTTGKNVGSVTLYDSPSTNYRSKEGVNKTHTIAMQPLTFQIYNSLNQSDYAGGFTPDIEVDELNYIDGYLAFGDENETLLKAALNNIKGISARPSTYNNLNISTGVDLDQNHFSKEMYFEEHFEGYLKK